MNGLIALATPPHPHPLPLRGRGDSIDSLSLGEGEGWGEGSVEFTNSPGSGTGDARRAAGVGDGDGGRKGAEVEQEEASHAAPTDGRVISRRSRASAGCDRVALSRHQERRAVVAVDEEGRELLGGHAPEARGEGAAADAADEEPLGAREARGLERLT